MYTRDKTIELAQAGMVLFEIIDEHLSPELFEGLLEPIEDSYNIIAPYCTGILKP